MGLVMSEVKHPTYIASRGRALTCTTPEILESGGVDTFYLVVEPQEADEYRERFGDDRVLVLPFSDRGIAAARTWIKKYSEQQGEAWHWQFDDDILRFCIRKEKEPNVIVPASEPMTFVETFADKYSNIGACGIASIQWPTKKPIVVNQQVYTTVLVLNGTPFYWRDNCVEDTDFSLQILANGWCTVLFKNYRAQSSPTMSMPGGNTDITHGGELGDRRAYRTRGLQSKWPGLIKMKRGCGLPKASTAHLWKKFTTPLKEKE